MDLTKEALEYIAQQKRPETIEANGEIFMLKDYSRVDKELRAEPLSISSLTGIVDYIKSNTDILPTQLIVQVADYDTVRILSPLDMDRKRACFVEAKADVPEFNFGHFQFTETFIIGLQSKFIADDETDYQTVLQFAGTVEAGTVGNYSDDGVSQSATVKTGITRKEQKIVPNPVKLRPYRTFPECKQPISEFVFRMKQNNLDGVQAALFEADGGAWKQACRNEIKNYLEYELLDNETNELTHGVSIIA